jgi:hypothetical protein
MRVAHGIIAWEVVVHLDGRHKAIPVAMPGLDHALGAPAVADSLVSLRQTGIQGGGTGKLSGPQVGGRFLS